MFRAFIVQLKARLLMSRQRAIFFLEQQPHFHANNCPFCGHHCDKLTPSGQEANNVHPAFSFVDVWMCCHDDTRPPRFLRAWARVRFFFACVVAVIFATAKHFTRVWAKMQEKRVGVEGRSSYAEIKKRSGWRKSNKWPWPKHRIGFNWLSTNTPSWESADREGLN